ncbi:hypothetical protein AVEN_47144-1 [Araneus ventricosus]|uniref:Uncharacterized protein n=1 Tax=Araneus ventricosus TaxID=182803 RepID=A0A4Y2SDQ4_ARAVE|nr:hypothetical protein AVEN_47144-1 [Araneus ventricosus]
MLKVNAEIPRVGEEERGGWKSVRVFEPSQTRCIKTDFGTSVNDLPKFFDWNKWNTNQLLGQMEWSADECSALGIAPCSDGVWLGKSLGSARRRLATPLSFDVRIVNRHYAGHNRRTYKPNEPRRFFLFRRWGITRTADGTRGKIGRRNAALGAVYRSRDRQIFLMPRLA